MRFYILYAFSALLHTCNSAILNPVVKVTIVLDKKKNKRKKETEEKLKNRANWSRSKRFSLKRRESMTTLSINRSRWLMHRTRKTLINANTWSTWRRTGSRINCIKSLGAVIDIEESTLQSLSITDTCRS